MTDNEKVVKVRKMRKKIFEIGKEMRQLFVDVLAAPDVETLDRLEARLNELEVEIARMEKEAKVLEGRDEI